MSFENRSREKKAGSRGPRIGGLFFVFALFFIALSFLLFFYRSPKTVNDSTVEVFIHPGETIDDVAARLEEKGLVPLGFVLSLRYRIQSRLGLLPDLQAGRFAIPVGTGSAQILDILTQGRHRVYTALTIPPGRTSSELSRIVEEAGFSHAGDVLKAIRELAVNYPITVTEEGLQGYLFPDTYLLERPIVLDSETSPVLAGRIVNMMAERFFEILTSIDSDWTRLTRVQLHEKVVLASIIEREYKVAEEAPLIAAVFTNRLDEGMRLQSCATVVYSIMETRSGDLYREEYLRFNRRIFYHYLEVPSVYNTYMRYGLPPAPIAGSGKVALEAAFFPADSDALYFVVKDPVMGTHTFTQTLADHNTAKQDYLTYFGKS